MPKLILALAVVACAAASYSAAADSWIQRIASIGKSPGRGAARLQVIRQDYENMRVRQSVIQTPMRIGDRRFEHGLGTHSIGVIRVTSPEPIERFSAWVGVDNNARTAGSFGSVEFSVVAEGKELVKTAVLRGGQGPVRIDVEVGGARSIDLCVSDGGDGPAYDHADWADASITLGGGKTMWLDEMGLGSEDSSPQYPFSFTYDGKPSGQLLESWTRDETTEKLDADRTRTALTWTDPATGLRVSLEAIRYADFPAAEWMLCFENTGSKDTPIIENIQDLDLTFTSPMPGDAPYRLHKAKGGIPNPTAFEPTVLGIAEKQTQTLGSETGRSSTKDMPFFKLETGAGSYLFAVGWSGCWESKLDCSEDTRLRVTAGVEKTHFVLHPGEKVRLPRMLTLRWVGDTLESNAQFRQLIYKHYCARLAGKAPMPTVFCNTCFTRGGMWLNECNEQNQISLINAYAPLGLEAVMTDAGWFTGGWPSGAGNWDPRKDAYPNGMAPVAAAAKKNGMTYGLWFEPERVVAGTTVHKEHPEWCLADRSEPEETYLLNFGLPEVRDYFFKIVQGFMELPGFRVYRQDFNMDPLPYWRHNDAPDRQGITEIKYVMGLYAYWDRIATAWPDCLMEECASGGHRIDLETIMRLHIAQKTDYWFDDEADQKALWSVSQCLPNNAIVAHLNNLDEYSFHSTMASSLCLGWIADAPGFDAKLGKRYIQRYKEVRHLLVGAWYPLLPYPIDHAPLPDRERELWLWGQGDSGRYSTVRDAWVGSQYHRPDLDEGMLLVFRRAQSPYKTVQVSLHGLTPDATYEIKFDSTGKKIKAKGSDLMQALDITIAEPRGSDLIQYSRVP